MLRLSRCGARRPPEPFPPAPGGSPSPSPTSAAGLAAAPARAARLLRRAAAGLLVLAGLAGALVPLSPARAQTNNPATGMIAMPQYPRLGQLTVGSTASIRDADGMEAARFAYQWFLVDSGVETRLKGETRRFLQLYGEHFRGKSIRLRARFTDDAGNSEEVWSATVAVRDPIVAGPSPRLDTHKAWGWWDSQSSDFSRSVSEASRADFAPHPDWPRINHFGFATGGQLAAGGDVTGTLATNGDEDLFAVYLDGSRHYWIEAEPGNIRFRLEHVTSHTAPGAGFDLANQQHRESCGRSGNPACGSANKTRIRADMEPDVNTGERYSRRTSDTFKGEVFLQRRAPLAHRGALHPGVRHSRARDALHPAAASGESARRDRRGCGLR